MEAVFGSPEFKAIPFHEIDEVSRKACEDFCI